MILSPAPSSDSCLGVFPIFTNYHRMLVRKLKDPRTKCFNTLLLLNHEYMNLSDAPLALTATV